MTRSILAGAAALALIAASTQVSFSQPAGPGNEPPPQADHAGPPHPPPPPQAAAKFFFGHGHAAVTCPQYVSLHDCVAAATELANNLSQIHGRHRGHRHDHMGNDDGDNQGNNQGGDKSND